MELKKIEISVSLCCVVVENAESVFVFHAKIDFDFDL